MEFKQIQELIKAINKSNISELSIEDGDFKITIKQQGPETQYVTVPSVMGQFPAAAPVAAPVQAAASESAKPQAEESKSSSNTVIIKSPMIGTFYRSPSPDASTFVNVGDDITPGKVVCIIEAMKLFNEIESEIKGRIVKVLAEDASPVEYDQPLFEVEPA